LSQNWMLSDINTLRSKGGDVTISFGGAAGNELAQDCTTVSALQAQYQNVVSLYQLKHMDFDIEGTDVTDTAATSLRDQALHNLEQANPGLTISFTLPIEPYGMPAAEYAVVQDAIAKNVVLEHVNVMAMDFGHSSDYGGAMGTDAMWSGWSTMYQLQGLYPSLTHAQVAAMVGITPMIGVNNTKSEIFQLTDAQYLEPEALNQGVGLLTFWSGARDVACARTGSVKPNCSGVVQTQWEYSGIFQTFN